VRWENKTSQLLIAYYVGNISAKKYPDSFTHDKVSKLSA